MAINFAARANLREHRFGDLKDIQKLLIPGKRLKIHELRAASVSNVGEVNSAARAASEMPHKKGVDIAEQQIARFRLLA